MQETADDIIVFLFVISTLIASMIAFIVYMLVSYVKRQNKYKQSIEKMKLDNEKTVLNTQLEIQEQTFQDISREIHDNISLSLTLAKLHLHTFDWENKEKSEEKLAMSIDLLTNSIAQLSDISKSLNSDIISQHSLLEAIEGELNRIRKTGLFSVSFEISGTPVYMDSRKELIIFRIIQEAFNNILKHSFATATRLNMHYSEQTLSVSVFDNGIGYDKGKNGNKNQAGLLNMETRARILNGHINISSSPGMGTTVSFTIPFEQYGKNTSY